MAVHNISIPLYPKLKAVSISKIAKKAFILLIGGTQAKGVVQSVIHA